MSMVVTNAAILRFQDRRSQSFGMWLRRLHLELCLPGVPPTTVMMHMAIQEQLDDKVVE